MKIYRVHIRAANGRSVEYKYFPNRAQAKSYLKTNSDNKWDGDFETIETKITKDGLLRTLNTYGSHPDNGF